MGEVAREFFMLPCGEGVFARRKRAAGRAMIA